MRSAADLLEELNAVDESTRIEAKRASELGKSVMQTVIAFANEPGLEGGYLLLGVDWSINDKGDTVYRAAGLPDPDKVQRDLASQCASMLSVTLRPEMQAEVIDGKTVLVVYVAEVDVTHKPVYLKASSLPRGAYRRIGSTDQHCVDEDLWVLRGESQPSHGPDSSVLPDARLDDFDPAAITVYRRDRARFNPHAEELAYGDLEMLEALGILRRVDGQLHPTLAGIVLFGKPLALRRLLPAVRIDYIRVPGNEWVEDPENRFQSIDIRKPLLLALPQAEASIIDELPKGFRLPEGQLQSVQEPILPRKASAKRWPTLPCIATTPCTARPKSSDSATASRFATLATRSRRRRNWVRPVHVCAIPSSPPCCTTCTSPRPREPASARCVVWRLTLACQPPSSIPTARPTSSS